MVVTDLDGTLLDDRGVLSPGNRATLRNLGERGVLRVVATGRSLYSALGVLTPDVPLDYLVFSSGAGVVSWPQQDLLHRRDLEPEEALSAARVLREAGLDFMLHEATPHNHRFWFHASGRSNPDFEHRIRRYANHCSAWPAAGPGEGPFSQLIAVVAADGAPRLETLREELAPLHVVRTTSPLDKVSLWFEVFPGGVSKAAGAQWLLQRYRLRRENVLVVGNDFNDEDMLDWAQHPRVVANAPAPLLQRYPAVASNVEDGFSQAVLDWGAALGL
jgi:hydroxymethylpyrimidine pyrophosphatase-like HAD family hydrolase